MYYHIDPNTLTLISGPHTADSPYVRTITRCGTPEVLPLADYGLVPEVREPLGPDQKAGNPLVTASAVTFPAVDKTEAERLVALKSQWATQNTQRQTRMAERILAEPAPEDLPGLRRQLDAAKTLLTLRA